MPKTPTYRKREGRSRALVTLTDSVTKKRRDFWLGPRGAKESRGQCRRVTAEWEAKQCGAVKGHSSTDLCQ